MDIYKWEQLKEELRRKFEVVEETTEPLVTHTQDGEVKSGDAEILVLQTPIGKIKLVFETKPVVVDKKEHYSHQQGKSSRTEYIFSETEKSYKLRAYKWNDDEDDWAEIDASRFV
jgi:hypothetical protein